MSVLVRTRDRVPSYVPAFDRAVSKTAQSLGAVVTGEAFRPSSSWTEQHVQRGEQTVTDAVRAARSNGLAVDQSTVDLASALIWALPPHVPPPDVVIEDDGEIAFDWSVASDRVLTVSVSPNGYLGYAALIGLKPDYGRAPSFGSIPDTILFNLLRVYPLPTKPHRP